MSIYSSKYLREVEVGAWVSGELEVTQQLRVFTLQQVVEDVEVPLAGRLVHHSRLLQQVVVDMASHWSGLHVYGDHTHIYMYCTCRAQPMRCGIPAKNTS